MKKILLSLSAVTLLSLPNMTYAESTTIKVEVNHRQLQFNQSPVIENGVTLVPLRGIFEALGAKVDWDQKNQVVVANKLDRSIRLTIDQTVAKVSKGAETKDITLSVPATIMNGSTMVPTRFIAESFGETVDWNGDTRTVVITDQSPTGINNSVQYLESSGLNPTQSPSSSAQGEWQSLLNQLPGRMNGENGVFVNYYLPGEDSENKVSNDDIVFRRVYAIDQGQQKVGFSSYFDDKQASPVLSFPLQDSGAIRLKGEAGIDSKNTTAMFSIELDKNGEITNVWSMEGGGEFDLTLPYQAGETLRFTVHKRGDSPVEGTYWKGIQMEKTQINQELQVSELQVQADQDPSTANWTDSGMQVANNDILLIHADGVARHGMTSDRKKWYSTYPDGTQFFLKNRKQNQQPSLMDEHAILPTAPVGALIGIIQQPDGAWTEPFLIGNKSTLRTFVSGKLYMGYNDVANAYGNNSGSYNVEMHHFAPNSEVPLFQPKGMPDHLEVNNDYLRVLPGKSTSFQIFVVDKQGNKKDISKDKNVTYTVSDPTMIQVKGNTLKAGKIEGTATVTVNYQGVNTKVTVLVTSSIPTTYKAFPSQYTLSPGDTSSIAVNATYMDHSYDNIARLMEWKSEDPSIASVEGTRITAHAIGTTTITGNYLDIKTIKIKVNVK